MRKDARDDIHQLAEANGTAAGKSGDAGLDPEDKAAVDAANRQAEVGRNLPAAAFRGAAEVEGTINTEHKIMNSAEALGVKIHNIFKSKAEDKVKGKVKEKLGVGE